MRIVFFGSGAFAQPTLRWLAQSGHEIALVVTQPARGSGRGLHVTRTPVRASADEAELPALEAEDVNAPDSMDRLRALQADLGLVIAFGQKLGPTLLELFPGGCINLHASLLPKYRGAAPINWAIIRGETRTGCTVFRLVERMDAGPILAMQATDLLPGETAGEVHDRLATIGVAAVREALELFARERNPPGARQDDGAATAAPKLKKDDGHVHFDRSAAEIVNLIRGVTPWPGATARFAGADGRWENVQLVRARRAEASGTPDRPPGTIDARRFVATADAYLEISEIKPSGGRAMTWSEYVNGRHVTTGDKLVSPIKADG